MTENSQRLRAALDEVHRELEQVGDVDPEIRTMLQSALADMQVVLGDAAAEDDSGPGVEHESIIHRLTEAARHFEQTHPTLSGMLGSTIDALGRMGI